MYWKFPKHSVFHFHYIIQYLSICFLIIKLVEDYLADSKFHIIYKATKMSSTWHSYHYNIPNLGNNIVYIHVKCLNTIYISSLRMRLNKSITLKESKSFIFILLCHQISHRYKSCFLSVIACFKNYILFIEIQKYSSKTKQLLSNIGEKGD